jgi:hypothetical protein
MEGILSENLEETALGGIDVDVRIILKWTRLLTGLIFFRI